MYVLDIREVFDHAGLVAQQGRRNHRDSCILAAADPDLALQRMASGYKHPLLAQGSHLPQEFLVLIYYTRFRNP